MKAKNFINYEWCYKLSGVLIAALTHLTLIKNVHTDLGGGGWGEAGDSSGIHSCEAAFVPTDGD